MFTVWSTARRMVSQNGLELACRESLPGIALLPVGARQFLRHEAEPVLLECIDVVEEAFFKAPASQSQGGDEHRQRQTQKSRQQFA